MPSKNAETNVSMTFPRLAQNGQTQEFPSWAKYLAKIGHYVAQHRGTSNNNFPSIVVVCLPRIDYAALFTAYGVFWGRSPVEESGSNQPNGDLDVLLNKPVSYLRIRGQESTILLGRLDSVDQASGRATLITKCSKKHHFGYSIKREEWPWIRETGVHFDIGNGATERQRREAREEFSQFQDLAKIVGERIAMEATKTSEEYLTVVGEKSRFTDEVESLLFKANGVSISAGGLLNSEDCSGAYIRRNGNFIQLLASGRDLVEAKASIVIIEAGRRLGDQLQQLGENRHAIILVPANKRSHNDVIESLASLINFRGIHDQGPYLGEVPQYLKIFFLR